MRGADLEPATVADAAPAACLVCVFLMRSQTAQLNEDKPATHREYNHQLLRCAELQRQMRVFADYADRYNVSLPDAAEEAVQIPEGMNAGQFAEMGYMGGGMTIETIETDLKNREKYLHQVK